MPPRILSAPTICLLAWTCAICPDIALAQQSGWTPVKQFHGVDEWKMRKDPTALPASKSAVTNEPAKPLSQPVSTQKSGTPPTNGPVTILKPVPDELPTPAAPLANTTTTTDGDYWIVSARECDELAPFETCDDCLQFFTRRSGDPTLIPRNKGDFLASLHPDHPVSLFVHGSYVTTDSVKAESEGTYRWLKTAQPQAPGMIVFYTWPSDLGLSSVLPVDLNVLGVRSENYSLHLGRLISRFPPDQPVTLVGHSHGGRLSAATMHLMAGGEVTGDRLPPQELAPQRRMRLVLAAAALDRHWLNPGEKFGMALLQTEKVLNLHNSVDYAMNIYPLHKPFGNQALGGRGPSDRDSNQLGAWRQKIIDVDVAPMVGFGHTWPNYYHQPALAQLVAPYVFFNAPQTPPSLTSIPTPVQTVRQMSPAKTTPPQRGPVQFQAPLDFSSSGR